MGDGVLTLTVLPNPHLNETMLMMTKHSTSTPNHRTCLGKLRYLFLCAFANYTVAFYFAFGIMSSASLIGLSVQNRTHCDAFLLASASDFTKSFSSIVRSLSKFQLKTHLGSER